MQREVSEGSAIRVGDRVAGKFEILAALGQGGMGAVWRARNLTTGAEVALKVLGSQAAGNEQNLLRFRHEARLGGILRHRSIVRTFDLVRGDGIWILVMELLRGETLLQYLRREGPRDAKEAVAIIVPVLSALEHAHEMGVVHRDVKPSNIFLALEPDGHVLPKLLDFGIAKHSEVNFNTHEGAIVGTPSYMSPEQIRGETLDGRSDLFTIGAVLYEICTGEKPFHAKSPEAVLANVLTTPVDPDPRIEPRLWLEVQRALAKRPEERHATARELATAICNAVEETETSLGGLLRRSKPPAVMDAARVASDPTQLAPEPEVATNRTPDPPPPRARWAVVAAAIAGSALVVAIAIGASSSHASHVTEPTVDGGATTGSIAPDAPSSSVAAIAPPPEPPPTSSTPSAGAGAASSSAKLPPRRPSHPPKPIATTPGF